MKRLIPPVFLFPLFACAAPLGPAEADLPPGASSIPLWSDTPPASAPNAPAEHGAGAGQVAAVAAPRLWFFPAGQAERGPAPAVLIIPGGAYGIVSYRYEGVEVARELNRRGIAAAVLLYRCDPHRHPAPLLDARRAFRTLHEHAEKWGLDAKRLGVMGFSAGGHLAGLETSALHIPEEKDAAPRPAFCVLVYPVVQLRGPLAHAGSGLNLLGKDRVAAEADGLALDALADKAWPRTYIVHDLGDPAVPPKGSFALADRLNRLGVPVELRFAAGHDHGFGWNRPDGRGGLRGPSDWLPVVADWIRR